MVRVAALLAVLGMSVRCYGIREDELWCEEAVAHVDECCPGFSTQSVACRYHHETTCYGELYTYPDFSLDTSNVFLSKSCRQLEDEGICDHAEMGTLRWWPETRAPWVR